MIPEHVIALLVAVMVVFALARWGGLLFLAFACLHFCAGDWAEAIIAFGLACFMQIACGISLWFEWLTSLQASEWKRERWK